MKANSRIVDDMESVALASNIVAAYVRNNTVKADKLRELLQDVHAAVLALAAGDRTYAGAREPAVPIAKSVTADYIYCLEDGKKLKTLKRYLRTHYNLTPEEYRRKWRLPADYPMTAPNYAKRRSKLAKQIGLGTTATRGKVRRKKRSAGKRSVARRKAA